MELGRLIENLKSKVKFLKIRKSYDKVEKSESMRLDMRSRKARKLIQKTLKVSHSSKSRFFGC
ncbi:unnamed protein product [Lupinus luteus]|uniref:Uncharacterized protein n=1 Tax=Lupinus luteus TaxID=3873 RepID=A0AAV1XKK8_LUPLU